MSGKNRDICIGTDKNAGHIGSFVPLWLARHPIPYQLAVDNEVLKSYVCDFPFR